MNKKNRKDILNNIRYKPSEHIIHTFFNQIEQFKLS